MFRRSRDLYGTVEGENSATTNHPYVPAVSFKPRRATTSSRVTGTPLQDVKVASANLLQMPMEIFFEILKILTPLDLLNVARTARLLRQVLMRSSSSWIWAIARSNVPHLLPLPSCLNEAEYADLAFGSHCHNCLDPGYLGGHSAVDVFWVFRARYCGVCRDELLVDRTALNNLPLPQSYEAVDPTRFLSHTFKSGSFTHLRDAFFHAEQVEELRSALVSIDTSKPSLTQSAVDKRQSQFMRRFARRSMNIMMDLIQYEDWTLTVEIARRDAIVDRLRALLKWLQRARPRFRPRMVDYAMIPEIRAIIENSGFQNAADESCVNIFEPLRNSESKWIQKWLTTADSELATIVRHCLNMKDEHKRYSDSDLMQLARLTFRCEACNEDIRYPSLISHHCLKFSGPPPEDGLQPYRALVSMFMGMAPWDAAMFTVSPYVRRVDTIIETCGLDPDTATRDQMNSAESTMVCETGICRDKAKPLSWVLAVEHCLQQHLRVDPGKLRWRKLPHDGGDDPLAL